MKKIVQQCLLACLLQVMLYNSAVAQYTLADSLWLQRMGTYTMTSSRAYDDLRVLCKEIGHRLSGSPQSLKAVEWAVDVLKKAGADTVWTQPVMVPVWERGEEYLKVGTEGKLDKVEALSLGNMHGTDGKEVKAPLVMFRSLEELQAANAALIQGKIVFLNVPFPAEELNTFAAYSRVYRIRTQSAGIVCAKGGVGVIIRSISTTKDEVPHTGAAHYPDTACRIPAMAIGNTTADALALAMSTGTVTAVMMAHCKMKGMALSYNVIGELRGAKHKDKYMLVGGHLDSWDVGEGAHDDGAGCVQAIQVLRNFKALKHRPAHTLRVVMFMNEENGNRGGAAYADSAVSRKEHHIFALESDAGGFTPRGIGLIVPEQDRRQVQSWAPLLEPFGLYDFKQEGCGVDISPLKNTGVRAGELLPDSQRYFDIHHCRHDVLEAVNERELNLGAAGITALLYLIDRYWN